MVQEKLAHEIKIGAGEAGWSGLYRAAGIGVVLTIGLILLDITLSFTGGDVPTGSMTAVAWFDDFQRRPLIGLRNLGLFNVINPVLTLPLYLALYQLHRGRQKAFTALALALFLLGNAVYIANNRALSMLALSQQYAAATSEVQKTLLATAGTVILAQAEDFTPGTFVGFFLSSIANLAMILVMLRGNVFRRLTALLGLVGSTCLLFFTIMVTFVPEVFDMAMLLALVGGLLMLAWSILMALGMFRLARQTVPSATLPASPVRMIPMQEETR